MKPKLLAIVGPTASGKSDLAMALAEKYHGEIIAADSRTVYRYMDIGTAKPTDEEMMRIPHHLIDISDPDQVVTAAEFKKLAEAAIEEIAKKGKLPILVGGSGMYIDSILFDYQFPKPAERSARVELEKLTTEELLEKLQKIDPAMSESIDPANRRRLIRAIETAGQPRSKSQTLRPQTLVLGLRLNKDVIQKRIVQRAQKMLDKGIIAETKLLGEKFGWDSEAMTGIIYRPFKDVVLGRKTPDEALAEFIKGDLRLVKKQLTWFKRNPYIHWLEGSHEANLENAEKLVGAFIR